MASVRKRTWKRNGKAGSGWVVDYVDQSGHRRHKQFNKKKDAEGWLSNAQHEIRRGTHTPDSESPTVTQAAEKWLEDAEQDGLEASTIRAYRGQFKNHIKPQLGFEKLSNLTSPAVVDFIRQLRAGGVSDAMARKVIQCLGALITAAQERGEINRNVVKEMSPRKRNPQRKRRKGKIRAGVDLPTKEEINSLLTKAKGKCRPLIVTAIFTGMRASELRGLKWEDVDLESGVIHVRRRADENNEICPPKSEAGYREILLGKHAVNTLNDWQEGCPEGDENLVFPNGGGNIESLANIRRRLYEPLQVECGIAIVSIEEDKEGNEIEVKKAKYGMHALRHFYASWLIDQGFPPKRVQTLLGHNSIQTTFDVYGHLFPDDEADQERLDAGELLLLKVG